MGKDSTEKRSSNPRKKYIPSILNKKPAKTERSGLRSSDFKSRFHLNLMEKKKDLEKMIDCLVDANKDDGGKYSIDSMIDELDRTEREMAAQAHYKFLDRKKNELNRINVLLDRISHDEDFGICEECGRKIPEARLLIIPEAVLCVPCQEDLENFESRVNFSSSKSTDSQYRDDNEYTDDSFGIDDDEGFAVKPSSEPMSLMDMDEIDIDDISGSNGENSSPAPEK